MNDKKKVSDDECKSHLKTLILSIPPEPNNKVIFKPE